ncbi:MAG TPA: hypothetical protein VGJ05_09205 [Fimbriiglobus sp.]
MNTVFPIHKCRSLVLNLHQSVDPNDQSVPMNSYCPIEQVVGQLRSDYDWSHSFIRECYFATSHCFCEFVDDLGKQNVGDTDGPQNVRLVVACAGNATDTGIEFLFRGVKVFSVQKLDELTFDYNYDRHSGHSVRFSGPNSVGDCWINADSVLVRFLGKSYLGVDLLVGFELPTKDAYASTAIEGSWRQCANCSNIWEESPKVEFSRCPKCGELTRLTM